MCNSTALLRDLTATARAVRSGLSQRGAAGGAGDPGKLALLASATQEALNGVDQPSFPPKFWINLATNNPLGRRDITEQDARDWLDLKWPVMETYLAPHSTARGLKRRVVNWWHRIDFGEIERARARGAEIRRSLKAEHLAEVASQTFPSQQSPPRADIPPLRISRGRRDG